MILLYYFNKIETNIWDSTSNLVFKIINKSIKYMWDNFCDEHQCCSMYIYQYIYIKWFINIIIYIFNIILLICSNTCYQSELLIIKINSDWFMIIYWFWIKYKSLCNSRIIKASVKVFFRSSDLVYHN